jgi:hypothetical protein
MFTEVRLLQQDVRVTLEGVSGRAMVGTVQHPHGNIAEALVREGLAKVVDWSIALVTGGPARLREAEKSAKQKQLRLWKDYKPSNATLAGPDQEFTGTVSGRPTSCPCPHGRPHTWGPLVRLPVVAPGRWPGGAGVERGGADRDDGRRRRPQSLPGVGASAAPEGARGSAVPGRSQGVSARPPHRQKGECQCVYVFVRLCAPTSPTCMSSYTHGCTVG